MRGIGGLAVAGLVGLVAVIATPAAANGSAAPAAAVSETVKARAARWVIAARVRLRAAPSAEAAVLGGVEFNTPLTLHATSGDWCEVERGDGVRGYVACRFLDAEPLDFDAISQPRHGRGPSQYDPVRAFALQPTWETFATYAYELERRRRENGDTAAPAPDATLVWMEEHLAMGAYGATPAPRVDVATLQRRVALAARDDATVETRRATNDAARDALQLWADPFYDAGERAMGVAASLALPPVRASYFGTDGEVAAGSDLPDALSGRFGIVHRWVVTPAKRLTDDDGYPVATYGMDAGINLLVRPLQRVQLAVDGRLTATSSHARDRRTMTEGEHGMCPGWTPGFAVGGLDPRDAAWSYFDQYWPEARKEAAHPADQLYAFYVESRLPHAAATVTTRTHVLDRVATGFASATSHVFDIDHDAVPDLLVWEAVGYGPGHLEGPTATDDTWYRLVLVNVGGRWKVLGADQFSYGCGC